MRVLVYGADAETALGRMCARGLESLGHDVAYVERNLRTFPLIGPLNLDEAHDRFETTATELDVDAVLVMKGYDVSQELLEQIRLSTDAVLCNWNPDNPYKIRSKERVATKYLDTLPAYDIVFTWGEFLLDRLRKDGADDVRYLPFAHDPQFHYPAKAHNEYDCEVAFLGHYSPKRERYLSALTDLDFQLRGNMWRWKCFDWSLRRCYYGAALGHPSYTRAMASTDIVVNVVADHNLPEHNMRTFEAPASGSLMVTTRSEGQQQYFPDKEACVMYDDPAELQDVVAQYLDDDEEREAIAARGREWVEGHTYEQRMAKLVNAVSEYK
ncbi:glycosyltransferase [Halorubrum sp. GN11GM_10-3_MGM]|uniref:CgeB family protein n=1 Tax=Halorubrum sp. GN11GM_10-3_MGM TaxID=2518111 RepID=UPI0013053B06|nr:glycosyltransferase [Halorubrum sp. GN11GM_10-3_MGM]